MSDIVLAGNSSSSLYVGMMSVWRRVFGHLASSSSATVGDDDDGALPLRPSSSVARTSVGMVVVVVAQP